jgi:hypothetical protein
MSPRILWQQPEMKNRDSRGEPGTRSAATYCHILRYIAAVKRATSFVAAKEGLGLILSWRPCLGHLPKFGSHFLLGETLPLLPRMK